MLTLQRYIRAALVTVLLAQAAAASAQRVEPIGYTLRFPAPATRTFDVELRVPTDGRATIELMMPVWSPGFYRVENYADRVVSFSARTAAAAELQVERPSANRWRVQARGEPVIVFSYRLQANRGSVTGNAVNDTIGVLNGPATFIGVVGAAQRPHEVRIELPPQWPAAATSLVRAGEAYTAPDYDTLLDSPIVLGTLSVHEFAVAGVKHYLVDAGAIGGWDGARAAQDLHKIVQETHRFWGVLPFPHYYFLNVFRAGGGGLEHLNSTLLTSAPRPSGYTSSFRWLAFVSHEYFHAFNVKRLRPVELGPFDYEQPAATANLWVSEGLTSYYGELLAARAGLGTADDYLRSVSAHIRSLGNSGGRLVQTLEQASLQVWNSGSTSGVGGNAATTVSYYVKGPVVGFLLDARIRQETNGRRSLDDVMRLAYARYSGARGFTTAQFESAAAEVAGVDLREFFQSALRTTEELNYTPALDWYGLRFAASADAATAWTLELRPDATPAQQAHLRALLAPSGAPASPEGNGNKRPGNRTLIAGPSPAAAPARGLEPLTR